MNLVPQLHTLWDLYKYYPKFFHIFSQTVFLQANWAIQYAQIIIILLVFLLKYKSIRKLYSA